MTVADRNRTVPRWRRAAAAAAVAAWTAVTAWIAVPAAARAADWPAWGRDASRNMVSGEKGLPASFSAGKLRASTEEVDLATTRNVRWAVKLGSQCYGNPTVAGGRVYVGTNNEVPRNPAHRGDRGVLLALDEATGKLLWQLVVPKLGSGKVNDWEQLGICSSPAVEGDRAWIVTNRCEVVCLDVKGLADGNDGPYRDEAKGMSTGGKPVALSPTDADVVWRYDMRGELGVFPHNMTSSSPLLLGPRVFVSTSNGQDWTHVNIPNPRAPLLIALDRGSGRLLGEEGAGMSTRILHGAWSSQSAGTVRGRELVFFGGADGFCYAFAAEPVKRPDGTAVLEEVWRFDCNPPEHKAKDGQPIKYPSRGGASEIIATPVFHGGRVYVAVGQDPEHGMGVGSLSCIDAAAGTGDITKTGLVWRHQINRSLSTVAITGDLLFTADFSGYVYCLDAASGRLHWQHDTESNIWGSPLAADGKVYVGNEAGNLYAFEASRERKLVAETAMGAPIYSSPVAAGGALYVATQTHLFAVRDSSRSDARAR
jgi:outer membrane protein assembly factor BamB